MKKRIYFLLPYPLHRAPSQRFRVEAYFRILVDNEIGFEADVFLNEDAWNILYQNGSIVQKGIAVIKGFLKRLYKITFVVPGYDYVFVHREASPIGPPVFEFIVCKLLRKKMIYDFDDAIWIPNTSNENKIASWFKAFWKIKFICRWAYTVCGGNEFLCTYARNYNARVVLLPTSVDTVTRYTDKKEHSTEKIIIGWTGSHSTMHYLNEIVPTLRRTILEHGVHLLIISNKEPEFKVPNLEFIYWNEKNEIADLLQMNIGIMPLKEDAWSEGKCGFKLIQYLALGIPAVASPVGVNKQIIEEGETGFLCGSDDEWLDALKKLIKDVQLREKMGNKGREKIIKYYSTQANAATFLALFN